MRFGEIKHEQVVSVAGAERLGTVDDLFINPMEHKVLGLRVKRGGMLSKPEAVLLSDVQSIGLDAVTLTDASRLNAESKFSDFGGSMLAGHIIGSRVMTEHGHEVGTIADLEVDFAAGVVTAYVLGGSILDRLRKDTHTIPASAVTSVGERLVVVQNDVSVS